MKISSIKQFILCAGLVVSAAQAGIDSSTNSKKVIKNEAVREFVTGIKSGNDFNWKRFKAHVRFVRAEASMVVTPGTFSEYLLTQILQGKRLAKDNLEQLNSELLKKAEAFIEQHQEISVEEIAPIYKLRMPAHIVLAETWDNTARLKAFAEEWIIVDKVLALKKLRKTIFGLLALKQDLPSLQVGLDSNDFAFKDEVQILVNKFYEETDLLAKLILNFMKDTPDLTLREKYDFYALLFVVTDPWNQMSKNPEIKPFITEDMKNFYFGVEVVQPEEAAV